MIAFATSKKAVRPDATPSVLGSPPENAHDPAEGYYDARRGAAGYAPIVGTFGALAVPAVVVVFVNLTDLQRHSPAAAFAAGLLVVTVIGSIIGAISMAAIGGESSLTPNLTSAVMFAAVPVVIALVDVVAAFELLASLALPDAQLLLQLITGISGALGVFFTALALGDSWATHPIHSPNYDEWKKKEWIGSQEDADNAALWVAGLGVLPVLTGTALRVLAGLHVTANVTTANVIILSGLALTVAATVASALRTRHPKMASSRGPRWQEAYVTTLATSTYAAILVIFLP
ncbi:hypothetical protein [Streptomyces sp. N50]|uniref:hypothetical protein n=1 Tax=Streptomyces sp. N50 TaxID=3081765 RepID=UPI0029623377|nr:hypothetical protein [Streptomyces sp. N50]WOX16019.1 hypothetical protein R2B38_44980 [Streptomyces sp. N50]